jgi:hypothetical protein
MTGPTMDEMRIVAINGCLGYGYDPASFAAGMAESPHLIGGDCGSTDAGPYYLGAGQSLLRPEQIKRDLRPVLRQARAAGVPLLLGSAGFAGARPNLDKMLDILLEVAREEGLHFKLAIVPADVPKPTVLAALAAGRIRPMPGVAPLTATAVEQSTQIVGQMGTVPLAAALASGADVVLAGRSCDTAIYAALPIARGFDPALALHMAKIMECGAQCAIPLAPNDSLLGLIRQDHFMIRPLAPHRRVTTESVAAHTMYEQNTPFLLHEPEGTVDLRQARFEQIDARTVRVSGARMMPAQGPTTVKLEGARRQGARAFVIAGIHDAAIIANLDTIEREVRAAVRRNLDAAVKDDEYTLGFRYYGRDAVLGDLEPDRSPPREVGLLLEAIAPTQELANYALSLARSSFLHCPFEGRKSTAGNLAFPFSPSDIAAGDVYAFSLYHLMETDDALTLFPYQLIEV